ncbi:hypothetical protein N3114_05515 [Aliarcobacter butzleri]|jgi:hypothetical protein|uniref:hypothetical protein n=1 Tax=Aliarcobacter butzleri TaxID=28197 RepID=UPI0021B22BA1|nr:hypothetical protein [Aliarcobacter butzleri]UXC30476.1 hypothetical protein N3114_05515 [Aliarcobacter butzleri]
MAIKKDKFLEILSKGVKERDKRIKKVMISLTTNEYEALSNVANNLNISIPRVIRDTIEITGIFDEVKKIEKVTQTK